MILEMDQVFGTKMGSAKKASMMMMKNMPAEPSINHALTSLITDVYKSLRAQERYPAEMTSES